MNVIEHFLLIQKLNRFRFFSCDTGWSELAATSAPVQDEAKHIQIGHFNFPLPLPRIFSALFSAPKFSPPPYLPPPLLNLN
jgi:hypothetical protein